MNKKIIFSLMFCSSICLSNESSINQIWADIKLHHSDIANINKKFTKGDISEKKSEEKKYPIWKQLAQDYSNLSSAYFYNSKSSVGITFTGNCTAALLIIPHMPDTTLPANDFALIAEALKTGNVLDVRLFFHAARKVIVYTVIDVATNLSIVSGIIPTSLTVAPAQWYVILIVNGKQIPSEFQNLNNSVYLQMS